MRTHAPIPPLSVRDTARFWSKVDLGPAGGCWCWQGACNRGGYGRFYITGIASARATHRIAWSLKHGFVPVDRHVLHTCDNPPCVNPGHLYLGDDHDNANDRQTRGRGNQGRGEHHPRARLTRADVSQIRARQQDDARAVAYDFGITRLHVYAIWANHVWKDPDYIPEQQYRKLTSAALAEIRARAEAGESARALARLFGVSHTTIRNTLAGKINTKR